MTNWIRHNISISECRPTISATEEYVWLKVERGPECVTLFLERDDIPRMIVALTNAMQPAKMTSQPTIPDGADPASAVSR